MLRPCWGLSIAEGPSGEIGAGPALRGGVGWCAGVGGGGGGLGGGGGGGTFWEVWGPGMR